jgi:hypothetical protein
MRSLAGIAISLIHLLNWSQVSFRGCGWRLENDAGIIRF